MHPLRCVVTLELGKIEVVSCNFDGMIYARKIINKHFALRNRDVSMPFYALLSTLFIQVLAMLRATRKRRLAAGSQDQFGVGSTPVVRISDSN
jgi:hypothetical protein